MFDKFDGSGLPPGPLGEPRTAWGSQRGKIHLADNCRSGPKPQVDVTLWDLDESRVCSRCKDCLAPDERAHYRALDRLHLMYTNATRYRDNPGQNDPFGNNRYWARVFAGALSSRAAAEIVVPEIADSSARESLHTWLENVLAPLVPDTVTSEPVRAAAEGALFRATRGEPVSLPDAELVAPALKSLKLPDAVAETVARVVAETVARAVCDGVPDPVDVGRRAAEEELRRHVPRPAYVPLNVTPEPGDTLGEVMAATWRREIVHALAPFLGLCVELAQAARTELESPTSWQAWHLPATRTTFAGDEARLVTIAPYRIIRAGNDYVFVAPAIVCDYAMPRLRRPPVLLGPVPADVSVDVLRTAVNLVADIDLDPGTALTTALALTA